MIKYVCQNRLLSLIIATFMIMVFSVIYKMLFPPQWFFSVKAKTNIVDLVTPEIKETKWRINGAIICIRGVLEPPTKNVSPLKPGESTCGSKTWSGYRFDDPETTLTLNGKINVRLETKHNHSLTISLRAKNDTSSANISFTDQTPDISLVRNDSLKVNIIWPKGDTTSIIEADLMFPFSGSATIGHDIKWSGTSILEEGEIQVYTSDSSPDKRRLIDETKLVMGDQLRLQGMENTKTTPTKGFVRFSAANQSLDVIAFGAADFVRIERYGDNGYDFKPNRRRQLLHDPFLISMASMLLAVITLGLAILPLLEKKKK